MVCTEHKAFHESILLLSTDVTVQAKPYEVQAMALPRSTFRIKYTYSDHNI